MPANRIANATHEVKKFNSPQDSVAGYFTNINTNRAYIQLRKIRSDNLNASRKLTGLDLAAGLTHYSERGHEYVSEIRAMIKFNQLDEFYPLQEGPH